MVKRGLFIDPVAAQAPKAGSKISALDNGRPLASAPPATRTRPSASNVAVCELRTWLMGEILLQVAP